MQNDAPGYTHPVHPVHFDVIQCSVGKKELCLLDGQVYHVNSGKCLNLLERGTCDRGQHLTVGEDGAGIIRIKYDKRIFNMLFQEFVRRSSFATLFMVRWK